MSRILIAEDEPRIVAFINKALTRSGFTTEVAGNGHTVLQKVQEENFDLLLLDLGLPGKDGIAILREMHQQGHTVPVIVVTAREIEAIDRQLFCLFDAAIISKPFLVKALLSKIHERLNAPSENSESETTD
ncbi:MAG: response regulator [Cyanobacteria bacterium J06626_4]